MPGWLEAPSVEHVILAFNIGLVVGMCVAAASFAHGRDDDEE